MMWAWPKSRAGRGSAPQEQFDWFSRRGRAEIHLFKTGHQFENRSLSSSRSNHLLVCGRPGHSPFKIGLRKRAKRIQDFVKPWHRRTSSNNAFHLNTKLGNRRPKRGLPQWPHATATWTKPEIPSATRGKHVASETEHQRLLWKHENTTWNETKICPA